MNQNEYTTKGTVRFSEIDHTGRITLPGIIDYFQDCSIAQTESLGVGIKELKAQKRGWILSSWQIIVERYVDLGEEIAVSTWATGFKGVCGDRSFCMKDKKGCFTAYAHSLWVYMDLGRGRPMKPPMEEVQAYGMGEPILKEHAPRKIELPGTARTLDRFPIRKYHIDTNEHVNNCQYVRMAMEAYPETKPVRQVRVEYKKSAVYKDMIVVKAAEEDGRFVVILCDEADKPYAVVEFR